MDIHPNVDPDRHPLLHEAARGARWVGTVGTVKARVSRVRDQMRARGTRITLVGAAA